MKCNSNRNATFKMATMKISNEMCINEVPPINVILNVTFNVILNVTLNEIFNGIFNEMPYRQRMCD